MSHSLFDDGFGHHRCCCFFRLFVFGAQYHVELQPIWMLDCICILLKISHLFSFRHVSTVFWAHFFFWTGQITRFLHFSHIVFFLVSRHFILIIRSSPFFFWIFVCFFIKNFLLFILSSSIFLWIIYQTKPAVVSLQFTGFFASFVSIFDHSIRRSGHRLSWCVALNYYQLI